MSQKARAVNFEELVEELHQQPVWGPNELAIWGGMFAERDLLKFVENWIMIPYRIWEYSSGITLVKDQLPVTDNLLWLERGRLFGEGGDLTLRRNGDRFHWHFVGPQGKQPVPPVDKYGTKDFFAVGEPGANYYMREETALLWGEKPPDKPRRFEDRVGRADLDYPGLDDARRVQVRYRTFSRAGYVEFVWFRSIDPIMNEEIENGK